MKARVRSLALRLLVSFVSAGLAIVGIEFGLRTFVPLPRWRPMERFLLAEQGARRPVRPPELRRPGTPWFRPGIHYETCYDIRWGARGASMDERGCVPSRINSQGWRGPEVLLEKTPEIYRIVAVGDSLTFGEGVAYDKTWPSVLEELLRRRRPSIEVVSLSAPAINLPDIRHVATRYAPAYRPDHVVYAFFLNDAWLPEVEVRAEAGPARHKQRVWMGSGAGMGDRFELVRRVRLVLAGLRRKDAWPYEKIYQPTSSNWMRCADHLRAIRDTVEGSGARFTVAILPEGRTPGQPYLFDQVHAWLHDWFEAEGIAYLDVLDVPESYAPDELWVHPSDFHPNEMAHHIIAEHIAAELDLD